MFDRSIDFVGFGDLALGFQAGSREIGGSSWLSKHHNYQLQQPPNPLPEPRNAPRVSPVLLPAVPRPRLVLRSPIPKTDLTCDVGQLHAPFPVMPTLDGT
jgi:hypothetical protein